MIGRCRPGRVCRGAWASSALVHLGYVGSNMLALAMTLLITMYPDGCGRAAPVPPSQCQPAIRAGSPARDGGALWGAGWPRCTRRCAMRFASASKAERVGLPGPSLTPYLVGLLVLLGMLGTFLGNGGPLRWRRHGAGEHHRPADDPRRPGGAGPRPGPGLRHLGRRWPPSAMLGLVSVLCRRERMQVAQVLDMANSLRRFRWRTSARRRSRPCRPSRSCCRRWSGRCRP